MRLLLDTHALIWAAYKPSKLSAAARAAIEDGANDIYVSAVSAMEIATKFRLGKLDISPALAEHFVEETEGRGFLPLPVLAAHGQRAGGLAIPHKDPFDRLLIAQSFVEGMRLASNEEKFDSFGVSRFW